MGEWLYVPSSKARDKAVRKTAKMQLLVRLDPQNVPKAYLSTSQVSLERPVRIPALALESMWVLDLIECGEPLVTYIIPN